VGRLREGVSREQAEGEFRGVYEGEEKTDPNADPASVGALLPVAQGAFALHDAFGNAVRLLLGGLGLLFLMACANVAGLMLLKAARRNRESAVRLALGASRGYLLRRTLAGSLGLGVTGVCGALGVAAVGAPLLRRMLPPALAHLPVSLVPDAGIDLLAGGVGRGLTLLFGLWPAWQASRVAPQEALRGGSATRRAGLGSRLLLVFQTAAALVLLVGTGLLLRTYEVLRHTSPGFDVGHLIAFTVDPERESGAAGGIGSKVGLDLPAELQRRVEGLPGVQAATVVDAALMERIGIKTSVAVPGTKIARTAFLNATMESVSSSFFGTLGMPVVSGRGLTAGDDVGDGEKIATPTVINEAFARLLFAGQDPVGRSFGRGGPGEMAKATNVVVGVVADSKFRSLREALLPIFYTRMGKMGGQFHLYVRTAGAPEPVIAGAWRTLRELDPQLPFSEVYTMQERVNESLWQERLLAMLAAVFAGISILMAGTGLYGLLAYDASQRTREFGIRSAVGAQKRDIAMLLGKALAVILVPGLVLGLGGSWLLARGIASALYGVKPLDAVSLVAGTVGVIALCVAAAWLPVQRAMRLDPAVVMREE